MSRFPFISIGALLSLGYFVSANAFASDDFDGYTKAGYAALQLDPDETVSPVNSIFLNFCDKAYNSYQRSEDYVRAKMFSDTKRLEEGGAVGFKINNDRASDLIHAYDPPLLNERELLSFPPINLVVMEKEDDGEIEFQCAALVNVGFQKTLGDQNGNSVPQDSLFDEIAAESTRFFWMEEDSSVDSKNGLFRKWKTSTVPGNQRGEFSMQLMYPIMILNYKQTAEKLR